MLCGTLALYSTTIFFPLKHYRRLVWMWLSASSFKVLARSLKLLGRLLKSHFWWTSSKGGGKGSKTHSHTPRSEEQIWVIVCGVFGCVCGGVPFKVVLHSGNASSALVQLFIVCTDSCLVLPLFSLPTPSFHFSNVIASTSHPLSLKPRLSLSVMSWLTSVMVFVHSLSWRSGKGEADIHTAHSKTANGFYLCRLCQ